jgi:hypothetical protein
MVLKSTRWAGMWPASSLFFMREPMHEIDVALGETSEDLAGVDGAGAGRRHPW